MKKTKRKAVINLIIFFLLLAGGIYMAIAGVGQNESGKTANVPLGLDLQGGLSVTYEIQDEKRQATRLKQLWISCSEESMRTVQKVKCIRKEMTVSRLRFR